MIRTLLASFIVLFYCMAMAEAEPVVLANCDCEVLDDNGAVIENLTYTGSPVPALSDSMSVAGVGLLSTPFEKSRCRELENGQLSMECAVAAIKAENNASFKCGQIAHSYFPERIDGFLAGKIVQGSCSIDLGEKEEAKESQFYKFLKELISFS